MSVDNPVEILLSFIRAIGSALNWAEEPRFPINTLIGALSGLLSLTILDLSLFVRSSDMVRGYNGLDGALP
jgi:hypothetical protein